MTEGTTALTTEHTEHTEDTENGPLIDLAVLPATIGAIGGFYPSFHS